MFMNHGEKPQTEESKKDAEVKRLLASFEENECPSCGKKIDSGEEMFHDGFCSEGCLVPYAENNPEALEEARAKFKYGEGIDDEPEIKQAA